MSGELALIVRTGWGGLRRLPSKPVRWSQPTVTGTAKIEITNLDLVIWPVPRRNFLLWHWDQRLTGIAVVYAGKQFPVETPRVAWSAPYVFWLNCAICSFA